MAQKELSGTYQAMLTFKTERGRRRVGSPTTQHSKRSEVWTSGDSGVDLGKKNIKQPCLVGGLEHFLFFHILGMSPSQLTFIFFKMVKTTNQM